MKIKLFSVIFIAVLLAITAGCDTGDSISDPDRPEQYLVSSEKFRTITQQQLNFFWSQVGQSQAENYIAYDIDVYRIVYNTVGLNGDPIEASGAIMVPVGIENPGLLSVQHATILSNNEAPSVDNTLPSVITNKAIFAAQGYITFLPDYLGFGVTADLLHPYQHKETLASASYDMILAGMEFIENKNLTPSHYMMNMIGYSEGAFATLALAERVEMGNSPIIPGNISLGGGIFNLSGTAEYIMENIGDLSECVECYAYFIYAYHQIYELQNPLSYYFQYPHEEDISDGLFMGDYSGSYIRNTLPRESQNLFEEEFIQSYLNGGESDLREALTLNDLIYIPEAPVFLAHGTDDGVAPVFNSDELYEQARSAGKENITYIRPEGGTHSTTVFTWAIETLELLSR